VTEALLVAVTVNDYHSGEEVIMSARLQYGKVAPDVMRGMRELQEVVNQSGLDAGLLELVKIRASQINGCAYCLEMHTRAACQLGEDEQRLYQLDAWRDSPLYNEREQAALAWTEAVTRLSGEGVPDPIYQQASRQFEGPELARLTLAIITINGWNRLNIAFRIPTKAATD
jgi:AhpD family alkylhydroperoxidase